MKKWGKFHFAVLAALEGVLDLRGLVLGRLEGILDASGEPLGPTPGGSYRVLGASWWVLGSRAAPGLSWSVLGASWSVLEEPGARFS